MEQAIFLKKEQQQIKKELNFDFCGFSKTLHFTLSVLRSDKILFCMS